jgi:hypothetical protein
MTWLTARGTGATELERVLALCPELSADLGAFLALFDTRRPVDPHLLALVRARIAAIFDASVPDATAADQLSERDRACLAFAEQFALDPHGITDADVAAVTAHLSAPEMVAFVEALALADGFTRFAVMFDIGVSEARRPR